MILVPTVQVETAGTLRAQGMHKGSRVVIPSKARAEVLLTLHTGNPGIVVMKALARSYVWWPGLDRQIEDFILGCHACQANRNAPCQVTSQVCGLGRQRHGRAYIWILQVLFSVKCF